VNTTDSFEPSIADEVEYVPPEITADGLDLTAANLDVNEGTNEYNQNLVNKVRKSFFVSSQTLPICKDKTRVQNIIKYKMKAEVSKENLV
jgi:hypothetical protein